MRVEHASFVIGQGIMRKLLFIAVPAAVYLAMGFNVSRADMFDRRDLKPAVCVIDDGGMHSFRKAWAELRRSDARALHAVPPHFILFHAPAGFDTSRFAGMPVEIVESVENIRSGRIDPIHYRLIDAFYHSGERPLISAQTRIDMVNDLMLEVPEDVRIAYAAAQPRVGSPGEILDRGIRQNTEFMLGTILVNVIFPESDGGSEDWTDEELADAMSGIVAAMSQFQQNTLWIDPMRMDFIYNYYTRIPVSIEPIEGDRSSDPVWIGDALQYLGYLNDTWETHALNNDTRAQFETDWVFTAYVVDASVNGCWQGGSGTYYAYGYHGGPYMVIPFPTCGWDHMEGFMHIFIHEVGHVFWALDEYVNAAVTCEDSVGYLNVPTRNTRFMPCEDPLQDCIMNNAPLTVPLPVCTYTLGQLGITDDNQNGVVDIYEVAPTWEYVEIQEVMSDTIYADTYSVRATVRNDAVPNANSYQDPQYRIDYAPWLVDGSYRIGFGPRIGMAPADSVWDESIEDIDLIVSGFTPGDNTLYLEVENCAGLRSSVEKEIFYVSTMLLGFSVTIRDMRAEVRWSVSEYSDEMTFFVLRSHCPGDAFAAVQDPRITREGFIFIFEDRDSEAGASYRYRVGMIEGAERTLLFETDIVEIPSPDMVLYQNYPNPFNPSTRIKFYIPEAGDVTIDVHDLSGKLVRRLLDRDYRESGFHAATWDGRDGHGREVSSGIYFYRLTAGKMKTARKMMLMK